jgi:hypothetical protein
VYVWDINPKVRVAEIQTCFTGGTVRGSYVIRYQHGRCKYTTAFSRRIKAPGGEPIPLLSEYRTDPETREWFAARHKEQEAHVLAIVAAEVKARVEMEPELVRMEERLAELRAEYGAAE